MCRYKVYRGPYSLELYYLDHHDGCGEPVISVTVGNREGEHNIALRMGEVPKLISFLQAIDQDNHEKYTRGGAE